MRGASLFILLATRVILSIAVEDSYLVRQKYFDESCSDPSHAPELFYYGECWNVGGTVQKIWPTSDETTITECAFDGDLVTGPLCTPDQLKECYKLNIGECYTDSIGEVLNSFKWVKVTPVTSNSPRIGSYTISTYQSTSVCESAPALKYPTTTTVEEYYNGVRYYFDTLSPSALTLGSAACCTDCCDSNVACPYAKVFSPGEGELTTCRTVDGDGPDTCSNFTDPGYCWSGSLSNECVLLAHYRVNLGGSYKAQPLAENKKLSISDVTGIAGVNTLSVAIISVLVMMIAL
jgi:hypothetical protein